MVLGIYESYATAKKGLGFLKIHLGVFLFAIMMLLPKFILIRVGDTGVRIDDFICLFAFFWLLFGGKFRLSSLESYIKVYLLFIFIQFTSAIINLEDNSFSSLLYPIRLLELLVWYFIGIKVAQSKSNRQYLRLFMFLGLYFSAYSFAEFFDLAPKFGAFTNTNRVATSMSGPFEYAVVIASLGFFIKQWVPKAMTLISLALTQSRVTIFSTCIIYLFLGKKTWRSVVGIIFSGLLILSFLPNLQVFDRFNEIDLNSNIFHLASDYYGLVSSADNSADYFDKTHQGGSQYKLINQSDKSLELRLLRWAVIYKTNTENIISVMIGNGPGFFGVAVDSYYVRVFAETGLIGSIIFIYFLVSLYRTKKKSIEILSVITTIIFAGFLIDIFVSVKVMVIFWFTTGFFFGKNSNNRSGEPQRG